MAWHWCSLVPTTTSQPSLVHPEPQIQWPSCGHFGKNGRTLQSNKSISHTCFSFQKKNSTNCEKAKCNKLISPDSGKSSIFWITTTVQFPWPKPSQNLPLYASFGARRNIEADTVSLREMQELNAVGFESASQQVHSQILTLPKHPISRSTFLTRRYLMEDDCTKKSSTLEYKSV